MITTGTVTRKSASCVWTSNPFMTGMCRSSTTQSGHSVVRDSRNSTPDGKEVTSIPAEHSRRPKALRLGSSSSTIAIRDLVLVTMAHYGRTTKDMGILLRGGRVSRDLAQWENLD